MTQAVRTRTTGCNPVTSASNRPLQGSARRQQVIDVAASIFASVGYHGVGTREIAEALGIKAASLYFHLNSKEQALEEVCVHGCEGTLQAVEHARQAARDLESRLRLFFAALKADLDAHADYVAVYFHERRHLPLPARERVAVLSRRFRLELDQMFLDAQEEGELHVALSPRSASLITIGTIRNLSQLYIDGPIKGFDAFLGDAVDALLRSLIAEPPRS